MKMFRERKKLPIGVVVVAALVLVVVGVLRVNTLIALYGRHYDAIFAEAGGLAAGSPVVVSGVKVGRVDTVRLAQRGVDIHFALTNSHVTLGDQTRADIKVSTILGEKALVLTSAGGGSLKSGQTIPVSRTTSPYDVTTALSQLTTDAGQIDIGQVSRALDTVSSTLTASAPELHDALNGVSRLSQSVASRDTELQTLLGHANQFSKILSDRGTTIAAMVAHGNSLMSELVARRQVITDLLTKVTVLATQLSGLVDDNEKQLRPTLDALNKVIALLLKNKDNLDKTIVGASHYVTTFGESVSSGPFFEAILGNLLPSNLLPGLRTATQGGQ